MASSRHEPGRPADPGLRPAAARGRPSKAVYRRRRAVALVLLLAVVAVVVWGVSTLVGIIGESGDAAAHAAEEVTTPASPGPCARGDLQIDLAAPREAGVGGTVPFTVTVTNTGTPCLVDVGSASLAVTVHSGEDRVWSSADCPGGATERLLLLDTGDTTTRDVPWSGSRSAEGCAGDGGVAAAGTYRAGTSLGGHRTGDGEVVLTLG